MRGPLPLGPPRRLARRPLLTRLATPYIIALARLYGAPVPRPEPVGLDAAVVIADRPHVPAAERLEFEPLGLGVVRMRIHYGFSQPPNIPVALKLGEQVENAVIVAQVTTFED